MNTRSFESLESFDGMESGLQHSDSDCTNAEEMPSDYVSALVRYDSYKFEKDVSRSSMEMMNDRYSDYYKNILNVTSFEAKVPTQHLSEGVTDLIRKTTFDIEDPQLEVKVDYEEMPEEFDVSMDHESKCDVCYGSVKNESVSTCKKCKVQSHMSCLLNSCNTVTELTPVTTSKELTPDKNIKNYVYHCKICLAKTNPIKRPRCCICNQQGGVFNHTEKMYYHPFCVYYTHELVYPYFNNNLAVSKPLEFKRFLIQSVTVTEEKGKQDERVCIICKERVGIPVKCKYPTCTNYLHPRCIVTETNEAIRKSPRNPKEEVSEKTGSLIFMLIRYQSNVGTKNEVFKGSFCEEHTNKKHINYTIYNQLANKSIIPQRNTKTHNKYKQVIDNILNLYFRDRYNGKKNEIDFKIETDLTIPEITKIMPTQNKKKNIAEILKDIKTMVSEKDEVIRVVKQEAEPEDSEGEDVDEVVMLRDEAKERMIQELEERQRAEEDKKKKEDKEKEKDKDKKEEDELLKVQKVLIQKFDIFNTTKLNPFEHQNESKKVQSTGGSATGELPEDSGRNGGNNERMTSLSSMLLYNKENKENILPLNSILFDNIKTNKELALCYQNQILSSCNGVIEYLNVLKENIVNKEEDENYVYVLFENIKENYILIYSISKKLLNSINSTEFKTQMQYDLKSMLSNSVVRESVLNDNSMFNNVTTYGIKDDLKYINSMSSTAVLTTGGGNLGKNKNICKKLKLIKCIKLNTFELELLKRSILELRNFNYMKLIVSNQVTKVHNSGGYHPNGTIGIEEKYINYIDWNKIINNIKNLYDNNNNVATPLKYTEYRMMNHTSQEPAKETQGGENYLKNEYNFIENELTIVNEKLVEIKNRLHENILKYSSNYYNDREKQKKNKELLNHYEFKEYYYHIIYNLNKLFSKSNQGLNMPNREEIMRERTKSGKRVKRTKEINGEFTEERVEEESKYCQICYNEEENNINVLVKCSRCLIVVHKYCYNIPISKIIRNTEYLCNRCEYEKKQLSSQYQSNYKKFSILCNICKRGSGPLTRNKDDWYHPFCYLIVLLVANPEGIEYGNRESTNINRIQMLNEESKWEEKEGLDQRGGETEEMEEQRTKCVVCSIDEGVMVECNQCITKFHPLCAYFQGFQFKISKNSTGAKGTVTCNNHYTVDGTEDKKLKQRGQLQEEQLKRGKKIEKEIEEKEEENEEQKELEMVMTIINNRYKRFINRDINDTIYDKDRKKRVIQSTPVAVPKTKTNQETQEEDKTCNICFRENGEESCKGCKKYIHKRCYPVLIEGPFKCETCNYEETFNQSKEYRKPYCHICLSEEDILIREENKYYHMACQIFHNCTYLEDEDIYFQEDEDDMETEEVEGIGETRNKKKSKNDMGVNKGQNQEQERKESRCNVCKKKRGFMVSCYKNKCKVQFHPNCGMRHNLVLEPYFTSKRMRYIALCQEHSLLHNTVGANLKELLKMRLHLLMTKDIFKDMYHQNVVLRSILRKRKEIYNALYPLESIFNSKKRKLNVELTNR